MGANPKNWIVGKQFEQVVGSWPTQVIPIAQADHARAVALVFAGFGDGDEIATAFAAMPRLIAKIPLTLARHIARVYYPAEARS